FALGGHSLLATQAVARLRRVFHVDLDLATLFETPSVAQVAARVRGLRAPLARPPLMRVSREGCREGSQCILPASYAQELMWIAATADPENPFYNVPLNVTLRGRLDISALEAALADLVERHEALRTTLRERGGTVEQVVHDAMSLPVSLERV